MILLAGGTGHLGGPLTGLLAAGGHRLRVLSRDPARTQERMPVGVEVVAGDVRTAASLRPALVGVETVISAVTGFGPGGSGPRQVDLQGNRNLIAEAAAAGVESFILVSIHGSSRDDPMELYRAKFAAEETLRESNLAWTIVRPTPFMELWVGIVGDSLIKNGSATVFGRGQNPINFVSVHDVASVVALAVTDLRMRGRTVDVGGPENLTMNGLVEVIAATHGLQPRTRHVPLTALRVGEVLIRPFRPDIAGLLQVSIRMDTADMSFDAASPGGAYPELRPSRLADIVRRKTSAAVSA